MNNEVARAEFLDKEVDVVLPAGDNAGDVVVDPDVVCTVVPSVEPNTIVPSVEPNTIVACSDEDGKSVQQLVADANALYQKIQGLYKHGTLPEQRQKLDGLFQSDMYKVRSCVALKQIADGMIANDTPAELRFTDKRIKLYNLHVETYCKWDASRE